MTVVAVEGLGKEYRMGGSGPAAGSLREAFTAGLRRLVGGRSDGLAAPAAGADSFWALRDVSFSIENGTRLGIIGRNGAGKSTLLKILSRITEPTTGSVRIWGRTASLLEIGTGFHPELTGRENVFLNGTLLGMSRAEVRRKLDEIVDFAAIGPFLDQPVKHYSSGMYVRLAFAIAAHVDPDILILDEVLAVGDLQFQRKCFGKMEELGSAARSVILVSHDLSAIASLCTRCIVMDGGRVAFDGETSRAILKYYELNPIRAGAQAFDSPDRPVGDPHARLLAAEIVDEAGMRTVDSTLDRPFRVRMRYRLAEPLGAPAVPNFHFYRADGSCAFIAVAPGLTAQPAGDYEAEATVPAHLLNEGAYSIGLALTTFSRSFYTVHFYEQRALTINLRDPRDDQSLRYGYAGEFPGVVRPHLAWKVTSIP